MLFQRKKAPAGALPADCAPAIRQSICTGELTGGYLDAAGKFHELRLLRGPAEKAAFCREMGVEPDKIKTVY